MPAYQRWQCPRCGRRFTVPNDWKHAACAGCMSRGPETAPEIIIDPTAAPLARRLAQPSLVRRLWTFARARPILTVAGIAGLGWMVLIVVAVAWFRTPENPAARDAAEVQKMLTFIRARVVERLVAPKTAEFDPDPQITGSDKLFTVTTWVDSQNAFGVPLRGRIKAMGKFEKVSPELHFIELDDKVIWTSEVMKGVQEILAEGDREVQERLAKAEEAKERAADVLRHQLSYTWSTRQNDTWTAGLDGADWLVEGTVHDSRGKAHPFAIRLRESDFDLVEFTLDGRQRN